jgi:hypothetical protein
MLCADRTGELCKVSPGTEVTAVRGFAAPQLSVSSSQRQGECSLREQITSPWGGPAVKLQR